MKKALILFGTLTFNTEIVAQKINELCLDSGKFTEVELRNMAEVYDTNELSNFDFIFAGTSTWSDGDFPPDGIEFFDKLKAEKPNLKDKEFAVFGLGEEIYGNYCEAAIILAKFMSADLEAKQIGDLLKVEGFPTDEVLDSVEGWIKKILEKID